MTRLREFARRFWPLIVTIAAVAIVVFVFVFLIRPGWAYQWEWAGFGASRSPIKNPKAPFDYYPVKTLWDWLQLLIIPFAVVGVGYVLNGAQQRRNRKATYNREMDLVLDNYLTQMAALLLQEGLSDPQPNKPSGARQLGRVQTLTALRRLDGPRVWCVRCVAAHSKRRGDGTPASQRANLKIVLLSSLAGS